ncbi:diaminopimelate decarboxylase [Haloferacaceae archaeon DSL9]
MTGGNVSADGDAGASPASGSPNPSVRRLDDWNADELVDLAGEYGSPLYVIDLDRVRGNCARLRAAFPGVDVRYAAKAHTGRAVLETIREAGLAAECASAGEVARARAAGFGGDQLHYTAVNPPAVDLDYVVDVWGEDPGLTITVGALDTLDRLDARGFDGRVCLRINPGVGAGHHEKVQTGASAKFGIPRERAVEACAEAADRFDLVGIHAHAGSGISGDDLSNHRELVRRMGDLARAALEAGYDLEYVDVGGGFGVPYRNDEPPLDLDAVATATRDALGTLDRSDGRPVQLAIEPGRYVVADAGVLLARVNTVKEARDATVAGVDAGMTTLLRPALYGAYHEIANLTGAGPAIPVTVAGPICESSDVFCEHRALATPSHGDVLAIGNAGAYGYEMASTYNSRPRPAEVALEGGEPALVRRRETIADLTKHEEQ